jgi:hypothetical protein
MHGYGLSGLKFYADQELLLQLMSLLWTCPANDVTGYDDPEQVLSLLVVLTVRARVYRRRNERFANNCIQEVDRFGGGKVMMCPAILHTGKTALVHIPGRCCHSWSSWPCDVLTAHGQELSLAVGTYPKGEICYSGKLSAPWIHVTGFHPLVTGCTLFAWNPNIGPIKSKDSQLQNQLHM